MSGPMGLVEMTNEEYHAAPGVSKSHLDVINGKSLMHYWHKYLNPEREAEKTTPAKMLGTAIHSVVLEPDLFTSGYVPNPGIERRSNAGKAEYAAFVKENEGKLILEDEDYQRCLQIRDAVHRHPVARGLLSGGKAEQTFFALDPDTGELVKCRYDYLLDGGSMAVDVKSTEDASPIGFGKSAANYRYDLQPPWYFDILDILYGEVPKAWAFLAFEKDPPYAIGIYYARQEQMIVARDTARRDFMRIVTAKRMWAEAQKADPAALLNDFWPDYGAEILPLQLPSWTKR